MTIAANHLTEEYVSARNALVVDASNPRRGIDALFAGWFRMRNAGARCTVDPLAGVTFSDVLEAVTDARVTGTPFVLPTGKGK